ncbi:MAG TPA: glycerophosphodiester phosphodiesterase family protein [Caulobacteraceae bacterium]|nr:glycerophosphodiester phosphodiesterase family protein [Caulobacteraceae bacterium]
MTDKPLLIAGATGYGRWPENTLEGARLCLEAPIDGIEIDVQITADGHVVAHHDYRLSPDQTRLEGAWLDGPGPPIKAMTLADLRRYDVGRSRPGSAPTQRYPNRTDIDGVRVPTLRELLDVLKAAPGPRRLIYVEIKTDPRPEKTDTPEPELVVDAVLRGLAGAGWMDAAKIIAFDWRVLRLVHERATALRTAHLTITTPPMRDPARPPSPWTDGIDVRDHGGSDLAAVKAHGGSEWSPYYTDVTPERVAEAKALGLLVGPWGLSAGDDIRRMAALGVYSSTVSGADWGD